MTNKETKQAILNEILAHDTIIISRHRRPDGDAVGSTFGLYRILKASFPEKRLFLDNGDYAEYVAFVGDEGPHPTDEDYKNALVIAIDTGTVERISNPRVKTGHKLVKIDHHIDWQPYGDISWVEEERSSACEMIVDFYRTFADQLKLTPEAATALYTGMVTDSGRFKYRGTDGETLRNAGVLLDQGIDMERIYAHLYMEDYDVAIFHADLLRKVKRTENGVATLWISKALRHRRKLTLEEASNVVGLMDSIKGSMIWLAFIENDDGSIRVRLRSRFVEVEPLAGRYHGGGHACAAGATVYSHEEMEALIAEADTLLKEFKLEHPDLF